MKRATFLPLLALLSSACSWSRFDDVGKDGPVVILKKPAKFPSFGASLAVATKPKGSTPSEPGSTRLLVGGNGGATPGAVFELGLGTSPGTDAIDPGMCAQSASDDPCFLGASVAGIGIANVGTTERKTQCFVLGAGKASVASGPSEYGLIGRCADFTQYTLPVPPDVLKRVIQDELITQGPSAVAPVYLSSDKDLSAALVATAPVQGLAWYYQPETAPSSRLPVSLVSPVKPVEEKYGASGAILRLPGAAADGSTRRIVAVGSPTAGHVWLFEGDRSGKLLGCLGGIDGLGRTMTSGPVDGDAFDDLVVADAVNVTVFSGAALANLAEAADVTCSLAALPPHAVIASFGCGSRDSVGGCPGGFATSLAVGDLDGDGDGEVAVGAPMMTAREKSNAGAVLVYDAEGKAPEALTDEFFLASTEDNEALGTAVVAAPIEGRDVLVAGAPGGSRAAVFYCSAALGKAASGSRCE